MAFESEYRAMEEDDRQQPKPRAKRFHHKVRSGCATCKQRRIKCDEGYPTCKRCAIAGRKCPGYDNTPRPWIFESKQQTHVDVQKPSRAVGHQFGVKHCSCGREGPDDITDLAREAKRNALIRAQWNYLTHNVNVRFGESPRDQRSLKFFLAETAPTIGNYGPCNMFWTRLVPQLAFEFPVIRHLLVAMALLDEQLGVSETTKIKPASLALWHYQMALRGMAMVERADEPFLVLASSMGWVFESLQGNFSASAIHLRASARLLKELESGSSDPLASEMVAAVKPMVNLSMSFSSIVHGASSPIDIPQCPDDDDCDDQPTEPWAVSIDSLAQARDMLIERLRRFKRADVPSRCAALALRRYIVSWRKRARIHCLPSKESSLHKQTMQILFIMALSFLPEDIAGPFSTANEAASRHLLDTIERLAVAKRETAPWDEADIDVTLSVALAFLAENLPDLYSRKRAGHLLASFPRAPRAKTNDTQSSTSGLLWNRFRPGRVTFEGDGDGDGEEGEIASGLGRSAIEKQYSRVF